MVSEVYLIIIMLRHSGFQADKVLKKDLRVEKGLHFDFQETGSVLRHCVWLEHI